MLPHCASWWHDSSHGVIVDSIAKTHPTVAVRRWNKFQDASCGRWNCLLNSVRNTFGFGNSWNNLNDLFISPAMCSIVNGDAQQCNMQRAKIQRLCAALIAFVNRSFVAHTTVGVLSHQHATCMWANLVTNSRTIHWSNRPVISRSEFEVLPVGLFCIATCFWISGGNSTPHTLGGSFFASPNHTPPAPACGASWYPQKFAGAGTRSLQGVGSFIATGSNVSQSLSACHAAFVNWVVLSLQCFIFSFCASWAISSDNGPLLAGTSIDACIDFPLTFSKSPNCTFLHHIISFKLF